jgi:hypothetical protein
MIDPDRGDEIRREGSRAAAEKLAMDLTLGGLARH